MTMNPFVYSAALKLKQDNQMIYTCMYLNTDWYEKLYPVTFYHFV